MRMSRQQKKSHQICGGNCSIVAEGGFRDTAKTQLDEGAEEDIFERHAFNRNKILHSVETLILRNKKLIPANCNADGTLSFAGGCHMIIHEEAGKNWASRVITQETTNVCCEQSSRNTRELIDGSMETGQRCRKPADTGNQGISIEGLKESVRLNGPAWLQRSEVNWPKPWSQENEPEPEQVISTVATETKLDQFFDRRLYSTFNRIKNFIAYCMKFKTKQKRPFKG